MNFKRMMIGFAALATLGSAPALAAPPDVSARQLQTRTALNAFDLGLGGDRVTVTRDGRRDLVMVTNKNQKELIHSLKAAYRNDQVLPNGYRVAGWAHLANDSHTFTLKNDAGERMVAEVSGDSAQTRVKIWGSVRTANPPRATPASYAKRRVNLP